MHPGSLGVTELSPSITRVVHLTPVTLIKGEVGCSLSVIHQKHTTRKPKTHRQNPSFSLLGLGLKGQADVQGLPSSCQRPVQGLGAEILCRVGRAPSSKCSMAPGVLTPRARLGRGTRTSTGSCVEVQVTEWRVIPGAALEASSPVSTMLVEQRQRCGKYHSDHSKGSFALGSGEPFPWLSGQDVLQSFCSPSPNPATCLQQQAPP